MGIAQGRAPLVQSPELNILHAPVSVPVAGKSQLVYELHVTNLRSVDIELLRVDDLSHTQLVGAGKRAVLYFWQPVESVPSEVSHRIEFDVLRATGRERAVAQSPSWKVATGAPVVLGPPLRGDRWVALYDPAAEFGHRRVLYTLDGRARIPGRFAIDWMKPKASPSCSAASRCRACSLRWMPSAVARCPARFRRVSHRRERTSAPRQTAS